MDVSGPVSAASSSLTLMSSGNDAVSSQPESLGNAELDGALLSSTDGGDRDTAADPTEDHHDAHDDHDDHHHRHGNGHGDALRAGDSAGGRSSRPDTSAELDATRSMWEDHAARGREVEERKVAEDAAVLRTTVSADEVGSGKLDEVRDKWEDQAARGKDIEEARVAEMAATMRTTIGEEEHSADFENIVGSWDADKTEPVPEGYVDLDALKAQRKQAQEEARLSAEVAASVDDDAESAAGLDSEDEDGPRGGLSELDEPADLDDRGFGDSDDNDDSDDNEGGGRAESASPDDNGEDPATVENHSAEDDDGSGSAEADPLDDQYSSSRESAEEADLESNGDAEAVEQTDANAVMSSRELGSGTAAAGVEDEAAGAADTSDGALADAEHEDSQTDDDRQSEVYETTTPVAPSAPSVPSNMSPYPEMPTSDVTDDDDNNDSDETQGDTDANEADGKNDGTPEEEVEQPTLVIEERVRVTAPYIVGPTALIRMKGTNTGKRSARGPSGMGAFVLRGVRIKVTQKFGKKYGGVLLDVPEGKVVDLVFGESAAQRGRLQVMAVASDAGKVFMHFLWVDEPSSTVRLLRRCSFSAPPGDKYRDLKLIGNADAGTLIMTSDASQALRVVRFKSSAIIDPEILEQYKEAMSETPDEDEQETMKSTSPMSSPKMTGAVLPNDVDAQSNPTSLVTPEKSGTERTPSESPDASPDKPVSQRSQSRVSDAASSKQSVHEAAQVSSSEVDVTPHPVTSFVRAASASNTNPNDSNRPSKSDNEVVDSNAGSTETETRLGTQSSRAPVESTSEANDPEGSHGSEPVIHSITREASTSASDNAASRDTTNRASSRLESEVPEDLGTPSGSGALQSQPSNYRPENSSSRAGTETPPVADSISNSSGAVPQASATYIDVSTDHSTMMQSAGGVADVTSEASIDLATTSEDSLPNPAAALVSQPLSDLRSTTSDDAPITEGFVIPKSAPAFDFELPAELQPEDSGPTTPTVDDILDPAPSVLAGTASSGASQSAASSTADLVPRPAPPFMSESRTASSNRPASAPRSSGVSRRTSASSSMADVAASRPPPFVSRSSTRSDDVSRRASASASSSMADLVPALPPPFASGSPSRSNDVSRRTSASASSSMADIVPAPPPAFVSRSSTRSNDVSRRTSASASSSMADLVPAPPPPFASASRTASTTNGAERQGRSSGASRRTSASGSSSVGDMVPSPAPPFAAGSPARPNDVSRRTSADSVASIPPEAPALPDAPSAASSADLSRLSSTGSIVGNIPLPPELPDFSE